MIREPRKPTEAFELIPLVPYRSACREARDALELAELVGAYRRLAPADRAHILKMSKRLAEWHN